MGKERVWGRELKELKTTELPRTQNYTHGTRTDM